MKRKYISPELEVQKFSFENILASGETDDKGILIGDSKSENYSVIYEEESGAIG